MAQFHWYESVPTVMSQGGTTTYINATPEMREQLAKDAPEWLDRAEQRGEPITVVTRQAVEYMLKGVDAKAVEAAKLDPSTTDVAAPAIGSAKDKEDAVRAKLATVLSVAEYEKLASLQETVNAEPVEEKPVDEELRAP